MEDATMRLQLCCAVFVTALFSCASAQALVLDWYVDHTPILVGEVALCTVADNTLNPVKSYNWEVSCANGGCGENYVGIPDSNYSSMPFVYHGPDDILNMRLTVVYDDPPGGGMAPPPTVITHSIHWLPPTLDPVDLDHNSQTPVNDNKTVYFRLKRGTDFVGFMNMEAQERQTKVSYDMEFNSGWQPVNPPHERFWLNGNEIVDVKRQVADAMFNGTADGAEVWSYDQENRLIGWDCCGQPKVIGPWRHRVRVMRDNAGVYHFEITRIN
jgi:hypothetical protein